MKKTTSTGVDRSKPPRVGRGSKTGFPKYVEKKLRNGLKLFVVENHSLPIVTAGFVSKSGSLYDGKYPGLASLASELLTKGTRRRNATRIAEEIDFVGASLVSNATWDSCQVFVSVLSDHLRDAFDVLQDIVLHPTFPEEEIERTRAQRLATIQQLKADPGYLADTRFAKAVFGSHPYGNPPGGTEESVRRVKREHLSAFHSDFFTPDNSFLVFAGDITPASAGDYVRKYFSSWRGKRSPVSVPAPSDNAGEGGVHIVAKSGAVQSSMRIGHAGISRKNPDYLKVFVMNTLFGGYFSSRINMNLREQHGYTYGGRSAFDARVLAGAFEISADVRNEVTSETIDEVFKELVRIRKTLPSKSEIGLVKNYLAGVFPIQLETPQQVAGRVVAIELYGLARNYYSRYRDNIRKVTAADIRKAAGKYIKPEECVIVLSGDPAVISDKLKKFGQIRIFDGDGNLMS